MEVVCAAAKPVIPSRMIAAADKVCFIGPPIGIGRKTFSSAGGCVTALTVAGVTPPASEVGEGREVFAVPLNFRLPESLVINRLHRRWYRELASDFADGRAASRDCITGRVGQKAMTPPGHRLTLRKPVASDIEPEICHKQLKTLYIFPTAAARRRAGGSTYNGRADRATPSKG
jgi:hypothetical protein